MTFGTGKQLQDADEHFSKGLSLAKRGLWKEALAAYQESLRINPGRAQTHLNIGFIYYELGYDQEAQQAFERASKLQARLAPGR